MARLADERLSPAARLGVAADLAGSSTAAYKEFRRAFAAGPSDELVARIRSELLPLIRGRHPRPRSSGRARYQRLHVGETDIGHFIAHASGGPPDINFFHQERRLNRGWSEEGRKYRRMERYPAEHPGTFHFTRAIYEAESPIPRYLELGVLLRRDEAERIANESREDRNLSLCFPKRSAGHLRLAWWIGVFDNKPASGPECGSGTERQRGGST